MIDRDGSDIARDVAREQIGQALIPPKGTGGLAGAFDQLETKLRQPYARALTEEDHDDIRAYINARVDQVLELLGRSTPDKIWSERSGPGA